MTDHTQLRKLAEAATPGPWEFKTGIDRCNSIIAGNTAILGDDRYYPWVPDAKTIEFIAKANPQAVLELLDEIERLKQIFRVNMLRAFPEKTHDEITAEIEKALK